MSGVNRFKKCVFLGVASTAAWAASAQSATVVVDLNSSFYDNPVSFSFDGAKFTLASTGDWFAPTSIKTSSNAAVTSFGGFLDIPVSPTTDFPNRGSGILTYGPDTNFSSFTSTTTVPYSNGDNYFGLRATSGGQNFYGYAFTTNTTLNSFAFETAANTAISINTNVSAVPEPASWAFLIAGIGATGGMMRRQRRSTTAKVSFT